MMKVYLAGRMTGMTIEEMNAWRNDAANIFHTEYEGYNIEVFNPCKFYSFENDQILKPKDAETMQFDIFTLVKKSHIILVNLVKPGSIGTAIEMHDAHEFFHIPVVAFGDKEDYEKTHPWVRAAINRYCETMEEAIDYIVKFYYPMFKR